MNVAGWTRRKAFADDERVVSSPTLVKSGEIGSQAITQALVPQS